MVRSIARARLAYARNKWLAPTLLMLMFACALSTSAQTIGFERQRGADILQALKRDIETNYYDSSYRGVNLETRFKAAEDKVKQATTVGQIQAIVAQVLIDFDDSHLYFVPPQKAHKTEYGWRMQMIGDKCYITAVRPGSDAEAKGVKPGDEIYSWEGYEPTRENLWKMQYFYYQLRPTAVARLVLIKPDRTEQELQVKSKIKQGRLITGRVLQDFADLQREAEEQEHLNRHRFHNKFQEAFIWKMPQFDLSDAEIDAMMDKVTNHKSLILDLRGNGGGYILTLQRLLGSLFDHDVKIGDRKGRKEMKPEIAKTRGKSIFTGPVVVLIDSRSASAAELFARIMQLEKRGTVIGDRSAGAVMEAKFFPHKSGMNVVAFYGASVTIADLIMTDGKSLERTGVSPDKLLLPTGADLAAGRDPVMAHAAELVNLKLNSEAAGALFPDEWKH